MKTGSPEPLNSSGSFWIRLAIGRVLGSTKLRPTLMGETQNPIPEDDIVTVGIFGRNLILPIDKEVTIEQDMFYVGDEPLSDMYAAPFNKDKLQTYLDVIFEAYFYNIR